MQVRNAVLAHSTRCHLCGQPGADQVDHVIPIALGGDPWDPANLRPAHQQCNNTKGAKLIGDEPRSRDWL